METKTSPSSFSSPRPTLKNPVVVLQRSPMSLQYSSHKESRSAPMSGEHTLKGGTTAPDIDGIIQSLEDSDLESADEVLDLTMSPVLTTNREELEASAPLVPYTHSSEESEASETVPKTDFLQSTHIIQNSLDIEKVAKASSLPDTPVKGRTPSQSPCAFDKHPPSWALSPVKTCFPDVNNIFQFDVDDEDEEEPETSVVQKSNRVLDRSEAKSPSGTRGSQKKAEAPRNRESFTRIKAPTPPSPCPLEEEDFFIMDEGVSPFSFKRTKSKQETRSSSEDSGSPAGKGSKESPKKRRVAPLTKRQKKVKSASPQSSSSTPVKKASPHSSSSTPVKKASRSSSSTPVKTYPKKKVNSFQAEEASDENSDSASLVVSGKRQRKPPGEWWLSHGTLDIEDLPASVKRTKPSPTTKRPRKTHRTSGDVEVGPIGKQKAHKKKVARIQTDSDSDSAEHPAVEDSSSNASQHPAVEDDVSDASQHTAVEDATRDTSQHPTGEDAPSDASQDAAGEDAASDASQHAALGDATYDVSQPPTGEDAASDASQHPGVEDEASDASQHLSGESAAGDASLQRPSKGFVFPNQHRLSDDKSQGFVSGPSSIIELDAHEEDSLSLQGCHEERLAVCLRALWPAPANGPFTPDDFQWFSYEGKLLGICTDVVHDGSCVGGKVLLGSRMHKPLWVDHMATTLYNVVTSCVVVTLDSESTEYKPGQSFVIPCGHAHSLTNMGEEPAVLFFTRIPNQRRMIREEPSGKKPLTLIF